MEKWKRNPQEQSGKYRFDGQLYITANVKEELTDAEISWIVQDVKLFVAEQDGIDYLQVYEDLKGQKLFFIDQLNDSMKLDQAAEHNYATLLFDWEY